MNNDMLKALDGVFKTVISATFKSGALFAMRQMKRFSEEKDMSWEKFDYEMEKEVKVWQKKFDISDLIK